MRSFYDDPYIERWIEEHRIPDFGRLDMKVMAECFNMEIVIKELEHAKGYLAKNKKDKSTDPNTFMVLLDSKQSYSERLFTFAHEFGHYFAWEVLGWVHIVAPNEGQNAHTELFCDWFARELLLPRRLLSEPPFDNLYGAYTTFPDFCVSEETFLLQRMARGDISPQFKLPDNEIICLRCCNYEYYRRNCSCNQYRKQSLMVLRTENADQLKLPIIFSK